MAYKQKKFISNGSGGWEVQDQDAGRYSVWWGPTSLFIDSCLHAVSSHGRRGKGTFLGHFYKSTNSIHKGSALKT